MGRLRLGALGTLVVLIAAVAAPERKAPLRDEPPLSYDAPMDRKIRVKPPLPSLGPAGSIITDPSFGTRILRVTDPRTIPGKAGVSFTTSSGSYRQEWSADSKRFYLDGDAGIVIVEFDPARLRTKIIGNAPFGEPTWSSTDPDILYGISDRRLVAYNVRTKKTTTVLPLDSVAPHYSQYEYAPTVSGDDTKFAFALGGIQDTHPYACWWDRSTGRHRVLNVRESTIDGKPIAYRFGGKAGLHDIEVDRSGRYVRISGPGIGKTDLGSVWDVERGTVTASVELWSGHTVLGYGVMVNNSGSRVEGTSDGRGFTLRKLSDPNDDLVQLIKPPPPPPYSWDIQGHQSWANVRPDNREPLLNDNAEIAGRRWGLWSGEIQAVATDGTGTVWRFAHNRSVYDGNFWDYPRGNISPDGRYFIFTSNWEKTLGADPRGAERRDVFLLELPVRKQR